MTIDKTYAPEAIEQHWYKTWENKGYFAPQPASSAFCMMLPPPNVTGSLHMGHGFGSTLMDVITRYQRMQGKSTLWQAGTDHAGIATQMVVERQLNAEGKTRHDLGRVTFVEKVWEWKEESGGNITRQLRRLGASLDWERERFTLDEELSYAVREVFIALFNEGLIYQGERLVNWDPQLLTAVSDLEVINEEADGHLWHIKYPLTDGSGELIVATTRPETMLGDTAVAVHPDDSRYQHLIGKTINLPIANRIIPIIADEYVDPEFGTGCVKITPAHDFNDFAVGSRHNLKPINIFTTDAHLNENVPPAYRGLERFKARKKIIADLETQGLLAKIEKHKLKVPKGEKTGAIIEPYLTKQWFMKMKTLAEPALAAVREGDIKFIPEQWNKTYFQWLENIEDWCISRQLWWGHRIPVWYDEKGKAYAGHDEADVRKRYQLAESITLTQDHDVLDTWFSSALWPFSTLGWPEQTESYKTFFPTDVLVTGFDIIFFWVARMIMMSLKFTKKVPFKEIYITGLIRDAEGQKMSKSKGNVLDPIDLIDGITLEDLIKKRTYGLMQPAMALKIEKATKKEFPEGITSYGTDALRFTFCSLASYTREIRFDTNRLGGYRNFCNKLWNASRYVMMNTEGHDTGLKQTDFTLTLADRWIISRLHQVIKEAHEHMQVYRFDLFAQTLYDFTWNEFCDWYLELSKPVLTDASVDKKIQIGTRHTLVSVLEALLRLIHPITPFITEEIWQRIAPLAGKNGATIMLQAYPQVNDFNFDAVAVEELEWVKTIVSTIRSMRSEMNISPAKTLEVIFRHGHEKDKRLFQVYEKFLATLAKVSNFKWLEQDTTPPPSISSFIGDLEIFIPMSGFINKQDELARLNKEKAKIEKELQGIEMKLENDSFVNKAPPAVVEKEKARQQELVLTLQKLHKQFADIELLQ